MRASLDVNTATDGSFSVTVWNHDRRQALTIDSDGTVKVYDATKGEYLSMQMPIDDLFSLFARPEIYEVLRP